MDLAKIYQILENNPSLKASKAVEAENLRSDWLKEKERYRYEEAKVYLQIKIKYPQDSIATIQAKVSADYDLLTLRLKIIELESLYKKAEIELERLDDEFTGIKKLADLTRKEMNL